MTTEHFSAPGNSDIHPTPVEAMTGEMRRAGAIDFAARMSVASLVQREVLFENNRWVLTPNDSNYREYELLFRSARLPYLQNNPHLGTQDVVVGEIPRSARSIPQVLYGKQPNQGRTIGQVFERTGTSLSALARLTGKLPTKIPLDRILILPEEGNVLILPPQDFVVASTEARTALTDGLKEQLASDALLMDVDQLVLAFNRGLVADDES